MKELADVPPDVVLQNELTTWMVANKTWHIKDQLIQNHKFSTFLHIAIELLWRHRYLYLCERLFPGKSYPVNHFPKKQWDKESSYVHDNKHDTFTILLYLIPVNKHAQTECNLAK